MKKRERAEVLRHTGYDVHPEVAQSLLQSVRLASGLAVGGSGRLWCRLSRVKAMSDE